VRDISAGASFRFAVKYRFKLDIPMAFRHRIRTALFGTQFLLKNDGCGTVGKRVSRLSYARPSDERMRSRRVGRFLTICAFGGQRGRDLGWTNDGNIPLTERTLEDVAKRDSAGQVTTWSTVSIVEASHSMAGPRRGGGPNSSMNLIPTFFERAISARPGRKRSAGSRHRFCASSSRRPRTQGLLYAGTEEGVYVSFDEESLATSRLNMPVVAIHDLAIEQDDLYRGHLRTLVLDSWMTLRRFDK